MRDRPIRSLGRRLSWWLAIQSFVGLGAVCVVVYTATAMILSNRQADILLQKQAVVRHLLDEAGRDGDVGSLRHKLDDFFLGHDDLELVLRAADGATLYASHVQGLESGQHRRAAFDVEAPAGLAGTYTATLTLGTASDVQVLRRLGFTLLAAAIVGAVVVSVGGFWLVRRGLDPVRHLVEQTRHLAADTLAQRLDGSAQPEELQPLIEQFNALLGRLGQAYDQLEGFNADVAHELCTPLTTLISGSELAIRDSCGAEALREVLGSNLEELHRMAAIVTDMLFLSQAERGASARREALRSVAQVASGVAEFHEAVLQEAGLRIEILGDAAGAFDVALLRRALSNLLSNAARHARPGSVVQIDIAAAAPDGVSIAVTNRGETIAAEHLPRLFDRFYRADTAREHADRNHGLGLSIVAAIARMHGGRPFARSAAGVTTIGLQLRA
ncbi:MAG: heavy metal sensor histidine kinase [Burkholderiaceae bacterium]|nr:heavy metal sensor histidine kinase [Burkholderiaceae bacterium]